MSIEVKLWRIGAVGGEAHTVVEIVLICGC